MALRHSLSENFANNCLYFHWIILLYNIFSTLSLSIYFLRKKSEIDELQNFIRNLYNEKMSYNANAKHYFKN